MQGQGTESSDSSLISDFFPTPRIILEISANLKRIFLRGGGMGIGVKWPKKALECSTCRPWIQKFYVGGPPDPHARNHTLHSSFNNPRASPTNLDITHFSDFLAKTHSDPWGLFGSNGAWQYRQLLNTLASSTFLSDHRNIYPFQVNRQRWWNVLYAQWPPNKGIFPQIFPGVGPQNPLCVGKLPIKISLLDRSHAIKWCMPSPIKTLSTL